MHRILPPLALSILSTLAGCASTASPWPTTKHADPSARALAEQVMERMGGWGAWEGTRYLHWRFFGRREHWWDKHTGDVRIESEGRLTLMNLDSRKGRVWEGGVELTDPDTLEEALQAGYQAWVNDSYWMFMPYKLLDPGAHLCDIGRGTMEDGRSSRVLELTFESVGVTPHNKYHVHIADDSGLVAQWDFYEKSDDAEPRFIGEWSGWMPFGDIWLATSRGREFDWEVAVTDTMPPEVFAAPASFGR